MARWDPWRGECWDMIRERKDCQFLFLTKRIEQLPDCVPEDGLFQMMITREDYLNGNIANRQR